MCENRLHASLLPFLRVLPFRGVAVFERLVESALFSVGGSIGFYQVRRLRNGAGGGLLRGGRGACITLPPPSLLLPQGDTNLIMDDIKALRPTIFPSVPRLFNRIYDRVMAGAAAKGGLAAYLFATGYAAKQHYLRTEGALTHTLWDALLFGPLKVRKKRGWGGEDETGTRCALALSRSAAAGG